MPKPTDSIMRLDKAVPLAEINPRIRHGWRGVMDMAHGFLELSADVKRYKTHKPLLNQEAAFRVVFTEQFSLPAILSADMAPGKPGAI